MRRDRQSKDRKDIDRIVVLEKREGWPGYGDEHGNIKIDASHLNLKETFPNGNRSEVLRILEE